MNPMPEVAPHAAAPMVLIGGGNMARALLGGWIRQGMAAQHIWVLDPAEATRNALRADWGVHAVGHARDLQPVLAQAQALWWAVKPQQFDAAAASMVSFLPPDLLQISVMAGLRCAEIAQASGGRRLVRAMPNTPALIGRGATGLYAGPQVGADERERVKGWLSATGLVTWVAQESQLDAVTALSGSGPAYVFLILEAWIAAATEQGLPPDQARDLALATLIGAAELAAQSADAPATLRAQVTSKGGTTAAALEVMFQRDLPGIFKDAMDAARARAVELGDAAAGAGSSSSHFVSTSC